MLGGVLVGGGEVGVLGDEGDDGVDEVGSAPALVSQLVDVVLLLLPLDLRDVSQHSSLLEIFRELLSGEGVRMEPS